MLNVEKFSNRRPISDPNVLLDKAYLDQKLRIWGVIPQGITGFLFTANDEDRLYVKFEDVLYADSIGTPNKHPQKIKIPIDFNHRSNLFFLS